MTFKQPLTHYYDTSDIIRKENSIYTQYHAHLSKHDS